MAAAADLPSNGVIKVAMRFLFAGLAYPVQYTDDERKLLRSGLKIGMWVLAAAAVGDAALWVAVHGFSPPQGKGHIVGTAAATSGLFWADFLAASAAAAIGALAGFLLGIPRALMGSSPGSPPADGAAVPPNGITVPPNANAVPASLPGRAELGANTNLEQISDKLTFLILGATLVQAQSIIKWIEEAGNLVALDNTHLVPIVIVYFFAIGFLGMYLSTRLFITFAFSLTLPLLSGTGGNTEKADAELNDSANLSGTHESLPNAAH